MNFREYIENKEDVIEEDAGLFASILGFATTGLLVAFGASLIVLAGAKGIEKLGDIWRKIGQTISSIKEKGNAQLVAKLRKEPLVKQEINKAITQKREYEDVLHDIYESIGKEDFITAKEKYDDLTPSFRNMPAIKQIIINEIVKKLGEPPIWPPSPGNRTYKTIRNILGLQEAKSAALAVSLASKKLLTGEEDGDTRSE